MYTRDKLREATHSAPSKDKNRLFQIAGRPEIAPAPSAMLPMVKGWRSPVFAAHEAKSAA
jgi:hypothetical protein